MSIPQTHARRKRDLNRSSKRLVNWKSYAAAAALAPMTVPLGFPTLCRATVLFGLSNANVQNGTTFPDGGATVFSPGLYTLNPGNNPDGSEHITGSFGPVAHSSFGSGDEVIFHFDGTTAAGGNIDYGDAVWAAMHVIITKSGGLVTFDGAYLNMNVGSIFTGASASGDNSTYLSGDFSVWMTSIASYAQQNTDAGNWSLDVGLRWTGASPSDTLSIQIPNNSIDVGIPEPASLSLLVLPASVMLARRNRKR